MTTILDLIKTLAEAHYEESVFEDDPPPTGKWLPFRPESVRVEVKGNGQEFNAEVHFETTAPKIQNHYTVTNQDRP